MNARLSELFAVSTFKAVRTPQDKAWHMVRQAGQWAMVPIVTAVLLPIILGFIIYWKLTTPSTHKTK